MSNGPELYSESVESYIIKVMYNRPDTIVELAQSLQPSDFHTPSFRYLFTAIKMLSLQGDITAEGIMTFLEAENKEGFNTLKNIGGSSTIESYFRDFTLPKSPATKDQVAVLKSLSYRRNAVSVADQIKGFAQTNIDSQNNRQFTDVEDLDNRIKELTYSLADNLNTDDDVKEIGSSVDELIEEINSGETNGIDISFILPKINNLIKRLRDGALYIFGAPEKTGKSTFMLHIAWSIADKLNIPVAYGDTEMQTKEQLLRICSKISGVPEDNISENNMTDNQRSSVDLAWKRIKEVPFYHFNTNDLSNNELESKVKLLQLKHGIRLFVYDYVKVMSHEVEKGRPDLLLASKIDTLKEKICKQCNIPVITSGQMWPLSDERGKNHKFAESSHFSKLGDVIARLDRVDPKDPSLFGTHYFELIAGRKVNQRYIGEKIELEFKMENHQVKEL